MVTQLLLWIWLVWGFSCLSWLLSFYCGYGWFGGSVACHGYSASTVGMVGLGVQLPVMVTQLLLWVWLVWGFSCLSWLLSFYCGYGWFGGSVACHGYSASTVDTVGLGVQLPVMVTQHLLWIWLVWGFSCLSWLLSFYCGYGWFGGSVACHGYSASTVGMVGLGVQLPVMVTQHLLWVWLVWGFSCSLNWSLSSFGPAKSKRFC